MTWLKQINKSETKQIRIPRNGMHLIREGFIHCDTQQMVDWLLSQKAENRYKMKFEVVSDSDVPKFEPIKKIVPDLNMFSKNVKAVQDIYKANNNIVSGTVVEQPEIILPSFSISVLCLNRLEYTKICIDSIFKAKTNCKFELILTDNASNKDKTKEFIDGLADPRIIKVYHKKNMGFIGGHKHALTKATKKIFLLLNNDVIVGDNWLEDLAKGFEEYNVKAVGTVSGIVNKKGDGMPYNKADFDYLEGSCLAVPTKFILEFGLFDSKYKNCYYEDFDLSLRLRSEGYKLKVVSANVKHERSILTIDTIPKGRDLVKSNYDLHIKKWGDYIKTKTLNVSPYKTKNKTIRIIREAARGDTLYVLPIARQLKKINPSCNIVVQTSCPDLIEGSKYIDKITSYGPNFEDVELIINLDMAHEKRRNMNIVEANQEEAGLIVDDQKPEIYVNETADKNYKEKMSDKYIVMHWGPSPGWKGRAIDTSKANMIANYFKSIGYKIIELGHQKNISNSDSAILNNQWDKNFLIIKNSSGFIGIDSSIMHIAQAFNIPGVAVFGCVNPESRLIKNSSILPVYVENLDCVFCWNKAKEAYTFIQCTKNQDYCMTQISSEMVIEKALSVICKSKNYETFVNINNIEMKGLKLDWGCGFRKEPGYVGVDIQNYDCVDIVCDVKDAFKFPNKCAKEIRSLHFIEHHPFEDIHKILLSWKRILEPGGLLEIYFPDLSLVDRKLNQDRACDHAFGQHLNEYDIHKSFWTPYLLCLFLKKAGFKDVVPIEYTGGLHRIDNNHSGTWTSGVRGIK